MTSLISSKVNRLSLLYQILKQRAVTLSDIQVIYSEEELLKSKRQIQRDLNDVLLFLKPEEILTSLFVGKIKYFQIKSNLPLQKTVPKVKNSLLETHFYTPTISDIHDIHIQQIQEAITTGNLIQIGKLKNDETGDNYSFTTNRIQIVPIRIILHRNSYFIGGYNIAENIIVFFSIRQLLDLKTLPIKCDPNQYESALENELKTRFGITKNINTEVYSITIEIANVLSDFIQNHHWHSSQKFKKHKGKTFLYLQCGINREFIGWLFQWMYNIKIVEPLALQNYYEKAVLEINGVHKGKKPLVYRNIF